MTEIALLRLASVSAELVFEIRVHAMQCPKCSHRAGHVVIVDSTRFCRVAEEMIERCIGLELLKRHPEGTR